MNIVHKAVPWVKVSLEHMMRNRDKRPLYCMQTAKVQMSMHIGAV